MAKYDFECEKCGKVETHSMAWEESQFPRKCSCGGTAHKLFPVEAAYGIKIQEPYYDEALGVDISGKREKQQILKAMGYQETGDKVHGARDFDKHASIHIKPLPPRGITLSDVQKGKEAAKRRRESLRLYKEQNGKIMPIKAKKPMSTKELVHVKVNKVS